MISQYIPTSLMVSEMREEFYTFLSQHSTFTIDWRNFENHAEGIAVYYDTAKTKLCCYLMVGDNKTPFGDFSGIGMTVFPYSTSSYVIANTQNTVVSETSTATKAMMLVTECGLHLAVYQTTAGGSTPWKNIPCYVFLTINGGFAFQTSRSTTGINTRGFVFKTDNTVNIDSFPLSNTTMTCFAPVCGKSQVNSNNQLFITPFSSTAEFPALLDSDIGRFVSDGYFAIPEFAEELN